MYIKFSTRDIKEVYESLYYHTQWVAWGSVQAHCPLSVGWRGKGGQGMLLQLWVVMWSLQPVLTLSQGITVCSHLRGNCMEILKGRI